MTPLWITRAFILARTVWSSCKVIVNEVEALEILKALQISHSMSIPHVIIKSDIKSVVEAINSSSNMTNELGGIMSKYCSSLVENHYTVISVWRQVNKVTHNLARVSLRRTTDCIPKAKRQL